MIQDLSKQIGEDIYFLAQYGSINYNTMHERSDIDWRGFVRFREDDTKVIKIANNDICINGFNQFRDMIGNMDYRGIELLFSQEVQINQNLPPYIQRCISIFFEMNNAIASAHTARMYRTYMDKFEEHMILAKRHAYYAYKKKYLKHAFRLINTLERFHHTGFSSYEYAMRYEDNERDRHFIKTMNEGEMPIESTREIILRRSEEVKKLKMDFDRPIDMDTYYLFIGLCEEIGGEY